MNGVLILVGFARHSRTENYRAHRTPSPGPFCLRACQSLHSSPMQLGGIFHASFIAQFRVSHLFDFQNTHMLETVLGGNSSPKSDHLRLQNVYFNQYIFGNYMQPFLRCPLQHLRLPKCARIIPYLVRPKQGVGSMAWSSEPLSLGRLLTEIAPGDAEWDDYE